MKVRILLSLIFFSGGLAACVGTALPRATPAQVLWASHQWPEMNEQLLNEARALYIGRCASCHSLVPPSEHTLEEWRVLLDEMAERAKITYSQKETLRRYLVVMKQAPTQ